MNVLKIAAVLATATVFSATAFAAPATSAPAQPTVGAKQDATAKPVKIAKHATKHKRHAARKAS